MFRSFDFYFLAGRFRGWLSARLLRQVQLHGVLIRVRGAGILIVGDSGVGKTETALAVVCRGHEWIADDAVMVRRRRDRLVGAGHPQVVSLIHRRGVGVVRTDTQLGAGRMCPCADIAGVVALEASPLSPHPDDEISPAQMLPLLGLKRPMRVLAAGTPPDRCVAAIEHMAHTLSEEY